MQCALENTSKFRRKRWNASATAKFHALSEVFPATAMDAGVVGFAMLGEAAGNAPVLWVQDRLSLRETGRVYLPGLTNRQVIRVEVSRPVDVLWAMEEALRCTSLAMVVGEVWGDPPALDFTATKRLALRVERFKVPCWLVRHGGTANLSAARNRWRVASVPSHPHPHDPNAPGDPRWKAELFRSRHQQPGTWLATYDRAADRIDLSAPVPDRTLAAGDGAPGQRAAR